MAMCLCASTPGCTLDSSGGGQDSGADSAGAGTSGVGTTAVVSSSTSDGTDDGGHGGTVDSVTASASTTEGSASSDTATSTPSSSSDAGSDGSAGSTTTSCVPEAEVCNGDDDDCDGLVDEGSPDNPDCAGCQFVLSASGSFYFALCTPGLTWMQARGACQSFGPGADLAIIDADGDQGTLLGLVAEDYWIGISDQTEEGHWVFVDGTDSIVGGEVVGFPGWADGQPSGGTVENCAELDPGRDGWADSPCDQVQPYICRHPA